MKPIILRVTLLSLMLSEILTAAEVQPAVPEKKNTVVPAAKPAPAKIQQTAPDRKNTVVPAAKPAPAKVQPVEKIPDNAVKQDDAVAQKAQKRGIKITAKNRTTGQDSITYTDTVQALLPVQKKNAKDQRPQQMRLACNHMVVTLLPVQDGAKGGKRQIKEIVCTQNVHLYDNQGYDVTADKITFYFTLPPPAAAPAAQKVAKTMNRESQVEKIIGEGKVHMIDGKGRHKRDLKGEKLTIYMRPGGGQEIEKLIGKKNVQLQDPQSGKEMTCDELTLFFREGEKQEIDKADGKGHVRLLDIKEKSTFCSDHLVLFFCPAAEKAGQEKDPFQFGHNKLQRAEGVGHCDFVMPGFSLTAKQEKKKRSSRPDTRITSDRSIINRDDNTFEFDGNVIVHEEQLREKEYENSVLKCQKMILYAEPATAPKDPKQKLEEDAVLSTEEEEVTDNHASTEKKSDQVPDEILIGKNLRLKRVICNEYVRMIRNTTTAAETTQNAPAVPVSPKDSFTTFKSREYVCGSHADYTVVNREIVITGTDTVRPWLISEGIGKPLLYEEGDRVLVDLDKRSKKADGHIRDEKLDQEKLKKKLDFFNRLSSEKKE